MDKKRMKEKLKNLNFKSIARVFSVLWMFVFIIVMTITNVGIDDKFEFLTWLGRAMILFGITVYGMWIAESMAKDYGKKRIVRNEKGEIIGGEYQLALKHYDEYRTKIESSLNHFTAFYDWYVPQRMEIKKETFLLMNGMNKEKAHNIVKYATLDDFFEMQKGATKFIDSKTKEEIFIKKLLPLEVEPVKYVLENKVPYKLSSVSYYLQAVEGSHNYDTMEMGEYYKTAKKTNKVTSYILRIGTALGVSLALGILTVGEFVSGKDTQAWMNLATRIGNLFTSMFSGWLSGAGDVHLSAEEIEAKVVVLTIFYNSYQQHLFATYSENESAKMQWEKQEKEKEEANKNVVEPEFVTGTTEEKPIDENVQIEMKPLEIESKE